METKIKMFATTNDTDKWAVCVDGYFGLFADRAEAEKVYSLLGGTDGDDGLADTAFGSSQILPPGHISHGQEWDGSEADLISAHRPIDIEGYVRKVPLRLIRKVSDNQSTPAQRLAGKHMWDFLFAPKEA